MNDNIIIENEKENEQKEVEILIKESFWDVYRPGALEPFVLHQMRNDNIYCANDFLDVIDDQPTVDAIEIVRCKDCKYAIDYYGDGDIYCKRPFQMLDYHDNNPDWFCAAGERKDDIFLMADRLISEKRFVDDLYGCLNGFDFELEDVLNVLKGY